MQLYPQSDFFHTIITFNIRGSRYTVHVAKFSHKVIDGSETVKYMYMYPGSMISGVETYFTIDSKLVYYLWFYHGWAPHKFHGQLHTKWKALKCKPSAQYSTSTARVVHYRTRVRRWLTKIARANGYNAHACFPQEKWPKVHTRTVWKRN